MLRFPSREREEEQEMASREGRGEEQMMPFQVRVDFF